MDEHISLNVFMHYNKPMKNIIDYIKEYGNLTLEEYPFNNVDSLILSQISYIKFENSSIDIESEVHLLTEFENEIDTLEEYKENKIRLQKQRESLLENIKELEAQKPEDPSRDNVLSQIRSVYDVLLDPAAESSTKGNFIRTIVDQIVFDKEAEMVYFDIII